MGSEDDEDDDDDDDDDDGYGSSPVSHLLTFSCNRRLCATGFSVFISLTKIVNYPSQ